MDAVLFALAGNPQDFDRSTEAVEMTVSVALPHGA